ncbi:MAG: hypothetical protein ABSF36_04700 [Candidatus Methanomethylicaceae archaeon]
MQIIMTTNGDPAPRYQWMAKKSLLIEAFLLLGMLVTLFLPPLLDPIVAWSQIPGLLLIRAAFWLVGLLLLPGMYIFRITRLSEHFTRIVWLVLTIDVSIVFVSLIAIVLYSTSGQIFSIPPILLGIIGIMALVSWIKFKEPHPTISLRLSKSHTLLLAATAITILIAFLVQLNWQYLFPTDIWQTLRPAVEIISQGNVYQAYLYTHYPVLFGYIITGLSTSAGLPFVNTYVLLFPLAGLNILTFYALMKTLFELDDKVAALASTIFGFAGGLGLLAQVFNFNWSASFLQVSSATQDMYFNPFFWSGVEFSYKSLAITFALASFVAFSLSVKFSRGRKITLILFSSLFMLFAFFIHMLPALLSPIFIFIVLFMKDKRSYIKSFLLLVPITLVIFLLMDYGMEGIYTALITSKLAQLTGGVNTHNLLYVLLAILVALIIFVTLSLVVIPRLRKATVRPFNLSKLKYLIVGALAVVYIAGIFFWPGTEVSLNYNVTFAWYLFVTRYGFLGILALIGIAASSWRESWFKVAIFWGIYAIALGSIWWGERLNAYLFPALAIFAAVGIVNVWEKVRSSQHSVPRVLRVLIPSALVLMLILSFSSQVYGAYWLITQPSPGIYDKTDEAITYNWIYHNTTKNSTFFEMSSYEDNFGLFGISGRLPVFSITMPQSSLEGMFTIMPQYFSGALASGDYVSHPINYILTDPVAQQPPFIAYLARYSATVFSSGGYSIQEIPPIAAPTANSSVAALDIAPLGIRSYYNTFRWLDDSFSSGWTIANINSSTDGEILALAKTSIPANNRGDPSITTQLPAIGTDSKTYLVIRYRNTNETTANMENLVLQMVSLTLGQGSTSRQVDFPLPFSMGEYNTEAFYMPANVSVQQITITLRNLNHITGNYGMDIDYIGIATGSNFISTDYVRFLAMGIPSLWSANYSIVSDPSSLGGVSTVVTPYYDNATSLLDQSSVSSLVLLNATASFPSWGNGWTAHSGGIVAGFLDGKKVAIVGVDSPQVVGNMTGVAADLYNFIYG